MAEEKNETKGFVIIACVWVSVIWGFGQVLETLRPEMTLADLREEITDAGRAQCYKQSDSRREYHVCMDIVTKEASAAVRKRRQELASQAWQEERAEKLSSRK